MSAKATGEVWDLRLPRDKKYVLLAYVDHADHEGRNIFPSIALIVWKTQYSESEVHRCTRELEQDGLLIPDGKGPHGVNKWRYPMGGAKVTPFQGGTGATVGMEGGAISTGTGVPPTAPEPNNAQEPPIKEDETYNSDYDAVLEVCSQLWPQTTSISREFLRDFDQARVERIDSTVVIRGIGDQAEVYQDSYARAFERALVGKYNEEVTVRFEP